MGSGGSSVPGMLDLDYRDLDSNSWATHSVCIPCELFEVKMEGGNHMHKLELI